MKSTQILPFSSNQIAAIVGVSDDVLKKWHQSGLVPWVTARETGARYRWEWTFGNALRLFVMVRLVADIRMAPQEAARVAYHSVNDDTLDLGGYDNPAWIAYGHNPGGAFSHTADCLETAATDRGLDSTWLSPRVSFPIGRYVAILKDRCESTAPLRPGPKPAAAAVAP